MGSETCFRCVQQRSAASFVMTTSAVVMINNTVWQAYGKIIARPPSGVMSGVIGNIGRSVQQDHEKQAPLCAVVSQVSSTDIATTEITGSQGLPLSALRLLAGRVWRRYGRVACDDPVPARSGAYLDYRLREVTPSQRARDVSYQDALVHDNRLLLQAI
jgi:hypothetical protein